MNARNLKQFKDLLICAANFGYATALYGSYDPADRHEVMTKTIDAFTNALLDYQRSLTLAELVVIGGSLENNFDEWKWIPETLE